MCNNDDVARLVVVNVSAHSLVFLAAKGFISGYTVYAMPSKDSVHLATAREVKYVFFDIVHFTKLPSIDAQMILIQALQEYVQMVIFEKGLDDKVRYIPTGDGMCIAFLDTSFDIHVNFAATFFSAFKTGFPNYQLRIGVGQSVSDFLFKDINGLDNFAGRGINDTARAMQAADKDTILCTSAVYDGLSQHEKYQGCWSKPLKRKVKSSWHTLYQYQGRA